MTIAEETTNAGGVFASRFPLTPGVTRLWLQYQDAAVSMATAFIQQAMLILSGVLAARLLGIEGRGNLAMLMLVPVVLTQVGTLGVPAATTYFIARAGRSGAVMNTVATGLIQLGFGLLLLHGAILFFLLRGESDSVRLAGLATLIAAPGMIAQMLGLAVLQGEQRFAALSALRILQVVIFSIATALIFVGGGSSLPLMSFTWAATVALTGAFVLLVAISSHKRTPATAEEPPSRSEVLRFGLKSLPGSVNLVDIFRIDQIVIGVIAGPAALGLYVVAKGFTYLPRFVAQSIGMVAYPRVAASESQARVVLVYVLLGTVSSGAIVIALAAAAGWLVPFFYGADFEEAIAITRVLLISALLMSILRVLNDCALGLGHPGWGVSSEVICIVVLLPALGVGASAGTIGVAWALVAAYLASTSALAFLILRGISGPGLHNRSATTEVYR